MVAIDHEKLKMLCIYLHSSLKLSCFQTGFQSLAWTGASVLVSVFLEFTFLLGYSLLGFKTENPRYLLQPFSFVGTCIPALYISIMIAVSIFPPLGFCFLQAFLDLCHMRISEKLKGGECVEFRLTSMNFSSVYLVF